LKESVGVARGDEEIIDLEENLQAVALTSELLLICFGGLEVEGIVDSDGDLSGDALHELDLRLGDSLRYVAAKAESAEAMLRSGEGKNRHGVNAGILKALHEVGITRVLGGIQRDERLLVLPNPTRGQSVDGRFVGRLGVFNWIAGFEDVKTHGVVGRIVKHQAEEVEGENTVETLGEVVEESFQVALLSDGLGNFEQGFDLAGRVVVGRSGEAHIVERWMLQIGHENEDSTRLGGVTTKGVAWGSAGDLRILGVLGDGERNRHVKNLGQRWVVNVLAMLLYFLAMQGSGCGSAPTPSDGRQEASPPGQKSATAKSTAGRYDLARDEERGGHTLSRHVARTDAQLEERLRRERNISAASTWTDRETAEETAAEALRAERGRVESWMRRGYPRANLALHYSAGRPIGSSLRRGANAAVVCTDAVIVLRADGPDSFYVLTTYPETRE
jgi:hypothetical protein